MWYDGMQVTAEESGEALFGSWLQEHAGLIFKISSSFAPDETDRQDLTQEILFQIWRSMPRFQPKVKVSTWLYRVALNTSLAWHRGERSRRWQIPMPELERLPADANDPLLSSDRELVDALYVAIRKLPKLDACLTLMSLDGLSYHEMAEVLGISEDNVGRLGHAVDDVTCGRFHRVYHC